MHALSNPLIRVACLGATLLFCSSSFSADAIPTPPDQVSATPQVTELKEGEWFGFEKIDFKFDSRNSLLVIPKKPAPGKPWIWRTEFFGHEPQADVALLEKGFHVAYTDVQNLYGAPVALDRMDAFHQHLTQAHQLSQKVVLEGFSRGGLFALNWAIRHPDKTAALYLDAPVCDIKSWPGGFGSSPGSASDWERCKKAYGFASDEEAKNAPGPLDQLEVLAKASIPILSVCGDADEVVPLDENSAILKERYHALKGPFEWIVKPGVKHHPHSLKDPKPIVDFVLSHVTP